MDTIFVVTQGNEYGENPLTDAYVTVAIDDAYIKFVKYTADEDIFGCALYEYDPEKQKFNLIDTYYNE